MGQQPGRNLEVILEQVAFGETQLGPKNLLKVGQFDGAAIDVEFNVDYIAGDLEAGNRSARRRRALAACSGKFSPWLGNRSDFTSPCAPESRCRRRLRRRVCGGFRSISMMSQSHRLVGLSQGRPWGGCW